MGTLLRQYNIKPDKWDLFLEVWRRLVPIRQRFGFQVLFAFTDRENNVFTWAITHEGDMDEAAERYYKDPDRIELEIIGQYIAEAKVTKVSPEIIP